MTNSRTNITMTQDPDMIWGMVEANGRIEMRFDCGDSGLISLTLEQATELRDQLSDFIRLSEG